MTAQGTVRTRQVRTSRIIRTALADTVQGFIKISHSGTALVGLALVLAVTVLATQPDLRQQAELHALNWLQNRQDVASAATDQVPAEPMAAHRATAALPHSLPEDQAKVAHWLSRKYRVAPEPLSVLVAEAFEVGRSVKVDPTLILAVMAIESSFNPFAQSPVGAQGLMQVLTRVHTDKYEDFGGQLAAFDPVANLRVGVEVLRDCIRRAGSVEGGLRLYVGAVSTDGSGYINKVMAEQMRIQSVAQGKPIPRYFPNFAPAPVPVSDPSAPGMDAPHEQEALAPLPPATAPAGPATSPAVQS